MIIQDNGKGMVEGASPTGHGLKNMEARAQFVGGTFRFQSSPGQGVRIEVSVPTQGENENASSSARR
jgi:signal transduction histidine kinase